MIELHHADWAAGISPELGGAVVRLTWRGRDVLRPLPAGSSDVLSSACFPLVPYANRIAHGRFLWDGRQVELERLARFAPHALHGQGWLATWAIDARNESSCRLTHHHAGQDWPWPYEARQTIGLSGEGFSIELSVTNAGDEVMPAGLGLHPYFPATPETRLSLDAAQVWAGPAGDIPIAVRSAGEVHDWRDGPLLGNAPFVDHCYIGGDGEIRLIDDDWARIVTRSPNARWTHVYAPGEGFCCIEPVTHRPDAVNAPAGEDSGLVALAPGETLSMSMTITVATSSRA